MTTSTNTHLYLGIADDLRRKINDGTYQPGAKLPSTAALEKHYGVSQNTVRSAMTVLRQEGLLDVPGPGRPTTVRANPPKIVRDGTKRYEIEKSLARSGGLPADTHLAREIGAADEEAEVKSLGQEMIPGGGEIGWILGLDETDRIHRYTFHISVRGSDIGRVAHHYLPADLDEQMSATNMHNVLHPGSVVLQGGTFRQLALSGIEPVRVHEQVTSRMPLPEERFQLGLPEGVPLLIVRKITYGEIGSNATPLAVEVVDVLMPADCSIAVYDIKLRRWPAGWRADLRDDSDVD